MILPNSEGLDETLFSRRPISPGVILRDRDHRQGWNPPRWMPAALQMSWSDLLFLHWPVPADEVAARLPVSLEPDLYQGQAYIGVVPFRMTHVAPRGFPTLRSLSFFLELNVRTYVRPKAGGPPGVYFFSLDCNHQIAVNLARFGYGLQYFNAKIQRTGRRFEAERTDRRMASGSFSCQYRPEPNPPVGWKPDDLDLYLTERYYLYAIHPLAGLLLGQIHHGPWPLQLANVSDLNSTLIASHGFDPAIERNEPRALYAGRVDVVAWLPRPWTGSS